MAARLARFAAARRAAGQTVGKLAMYEGITHSNGTFNGRITTWLPALAEPTRWRGAQKVFVNSMSDLWMAAVPFHVVDDIHDAMLQAPRHYYQVLTKRPERAYEYFNSTSNRREYLEKLGDHYWLGASAEDQPALDERWPWLAAIPAAVRWLSLEPLVGPIDLTQAWPGLHWAVAGGESGRGRLTMELPWMQRIADHCTALGVPLFVKQDSGMQPGQQGRIPDEVWALKEFPRSV
jgi:protein gp37